VAPSTAGASRHVAALTTALAAALTAALAVAVAVAVAATATIVVVAAAAAGSAPTPSAPHAALPSGTNVTLQTETPPPMCEETRVEFARVFA